MDGGPKRRGRRPVEELTDSQRRVLREIQDFIAHREFPPTGKELASRLGISTATVHEQISQLVRKGYLAASRARLAASFWHAFQTITLLISRPCRCSAPCPPAHRYLPRRTFSVR